MRVRFGHCIGCDQPIRPPYLSFIVQQATDDGNHIAEWEEADVCDGCAVKLTASDLHRLVSTDDAASGIEARQRPDPAEGLDPEGESPVPERQTPNHPSETP